MVTCEPPSGQVIVHRVGVEEAATPSPLARQHHGRDRRFQRGISRHLPKAEIRGTRLSVHGTPRDIFRIEEMRLPRRLD
jgi:hypothetical protein